LRENRNAGEMINEGWNGREEKRELRGKLRAKRRGAICGFLFLSFVFSVLLFLFGKR
jgi:hypothetical protein